MKKINSVFFLCIILSGCATQYNPTGSFVPFMEKKKDLKAAISLSSSNIQFAGAYSPFEHFAFKTDLSITQNYIFSGSNDKLTFRDSFFNLKLPLSAKNIYIEVSAGSYGKLNDKLLYEIYTGFGIGRSKFYYHYGWGNYTGYYFQPDINLNLAYKYKSKTSVGTSLKTNYNLYKITGKSNYFGDIEKLYKIPIFETYLFIKKHAAITTTFKIGAAIVNKNKLKTDNEFIRSLDYSKIYLGFNISYNFAKKKLLIWAMMM